MRECLQAWMRLHFIPFISLLEWKKKNSIRKPFCWLWVLCWSLVTTQQFTLPRKESKICEQQLITSAKTFLLSKTLILSLRVVLTSCPVLPLQRHGGRTAKPLRPGASPVKSSALAQRVRRLLRGKKVVFSNYYRATLGSERKTSWWRSWTQHRWRSVVLCCTLYSVGHSRKILAFL